MAFVTPYALISNLFNRRKLTRLQAPQFPAQGRQPISVGRPIYLRWQIVGVLVPVAVVLLVVGSIVGDDTPSGPAAGPASIDSVGECVASVTGSTEMRVVDCGQTHDGRVTAIVTDDSQCDADTTWTLTTPDTNSILCVATSFQ